MTADMGRRSFLLLGGSALVALAGIGSLGAAPAEVAAELDAFASGASAQEDPRLVLDIAETVENGSAVPVTVSVDSAMEGDDRVESIIILGEENPRPVVATFHFTPLSGEAKVSTRVRLADSQTVVAAARMSDGSVLIARRSVEVAIGGCIG